MGMVSTTSLVARRNTGLPASSQGITFLGWFDDLRTGSGSAGNHFGITDHSGGGEDLDIGPGAGIASSRATATVGQYTVFRTTGPAFAGFASAVIVTETGLCGIAIVSDATNVRSYYKVGTTGVLTAGGTVTATSFTPASAGINAPVSLAVGNWALFNRALDPWEIDRQLNQRALCIPDALFYASGIGGDTTTNETGGTNLTIDSGSQAAHAQDPGVGWRRQSRIYVPAASGSVAEMDGTVSVAFSASATLATHAATVGATACTFSASATASSVAAMTGAAAPAFAASATLRTGAALAGTSAASFSASAGLSCTVAAAGTVACVFSVSGGLASKAELAGSSAPAFSASSALRTKAEMTGAASVVFGVSGGLDATSGSEMAGTVAASFSVTGALRTTVALAGTVPVVFAASGGLATHAATVGTAACTFAAAASAVWYRRMVGTAAASFACSATLATNAALAGSTTCAFSAAGTLHAAKALVGTASLVFTATATIESATPDTIPTITAWAVDPTPPTITAWAVASVPTITSWAA